MNTSSTTSRILCVRFIMVAAGEHFHISPKLQRPMGDGVQNVAMMGMRVQTPKPGLSGQGRPISVLISSPRKCEVRVPEWRLWRRTCSAQNPSCLRRTSGCNCQRLLLLGSRGLEVTLVYGSSR